MHVGLKDLLDIQNKCHGIRQSRPTLRGAWPPWPQRDSRDVDYKWVTGGWACASSLSFAHVYFEHDCEASRYLVKV